MVEHMKVIKQLSTTKHTQKAPETLQKTTAGLLESYKVAVIQNNAFKKNFLVKHNKDCSFAAAEDSRAAPTIPQNSGGTL